MYVLVCLVFILYFDRVFFQRELIGFTLPIARFFLRLVTTVPKRLHKHHIPTESYIFFRKVTSRVRMTTNADQEFSIDSFRSFPSGRKVQVCVVSACPQKTPNLRGGFRKQTTPDEHPRRCRLADGQLSSLYAPPSFCSFGAACVKLCCLPPPSLFRNTRPCCLV